MKRILILITVIFGVAALSAQNNISYSEEDKKVLADIFAQHGKKQNTPINELVVLVGKSFLETPYVAHTLESEREHLIVNLRELDCTTYAENCLAIARCIKSGNTTFEGFTGELQNIRYRNGAINNYTSRLHYFSDWIYENDKKGFVKKVSKQIGNTPYPLEINFMSEHPSSYKQLEGNANFVQLLKEKEKEISGRTMYYIPKNQLKAFESKLKDGDIVGLTTSVSGLDITHVGILVRINGQVHLMHASSKAEKVVISDNTLQEYLNESKSVTGIMLARPI